MPHFPRSSAAGRPGGRRYGGSPAHGAPRPIGVRGFHPGIFVLPATAVALLGVAVVAVLYTGDPATRTTQPVLVAAGAGTLIIMGAAALSADLATRRVHRQHARLSVRDQEDVHRRLGELWLLVTRGRHGLRELTARLSAGEVVLPVGDSPATDPGDPFLRLAGELRKAQGEAWNAVLDAANHASAGGADQRVDVVVNLARRMQSLAHRTIQGLDELENQVEDPDLLKGLFRVDHLSTRMRRQAESLAVIGGAASRRQWSRPVTVYEVLRSAIAEVEHYDRVKVVPPVEGTLQGNAVADIVHLLAELAENATRFAAPPTQVLIRVEDVAAGLAIEVEDRGLGIPPENRRRLNDLLAGADDVQTGELLQEGRIGLLVVSALARRHNVRVRLQGNLYGGTQAVVVIPSGQIGDEAEGAEVQARPARAEAVPASSPVQAAGERPRLPRRQAQASLVPELLNPPAPQQDDPELEHDPGLMAAFQKGMRGAEESDRGRDGADGAR
ncbi:sensor histidine kinase [Spirillospora sp. CA-128828]|uniref:sensor histidine kinase n=1 Tax=Spirillospora sp. CA-128828 TaxID=3240033 RepID=UPI003D906B0F